MQCFKAHTFFCRLEKKGLCCCFLSFAGEPTTFIRLILYLFFLILIPLTTWHSGGTSENSAHQSLLPKYQKPSHSSTVSKGL